jgi:hypothetical protein
VGKKAKEPISFIHSFCEERKRAEQKRACVCVCRVERREKKNLKCRKWSFEETRKEGRKLRGKNQTQNFNNKIEWGNGFVFF